MRHFAHILDIRDTEALRTAASLHRIRRHGQPTPDPVDIRLIDSLPRRKFPVIFVGDERSAIYGARSAFLRRVHVQPVGGDAPARFENEVRPFTFNERGALIVGARERDPGDEISSRGKADPIASILCERDLRCRVSRRAESHDIRKWKNEHRDTRCNLRPMIRAMIFRRG